MGGFGTDPAADAAGSLISPTSCFSFVPAFAISSANALTLAALAAALAAAARLQEAFDEFTPGRQREFAEYIASAKREATRLSRLEKIKPMILDGVGLNDKYRK